MQLRTHLCYPLFSSLAPNYLSALLITHRPRLFFGFGDSIQLVASLDPLISSLLLIKKDWIWIEIRDYDKHPVPDA